MFDNDKVTDAFFDEIVKTAGKAGIIDSIKSWGATRESLKTFNDAGRHFFGEKVKAGLTNKTVGELINMAHTEISSGRKGIVKDPHVTEFLNVLEKDHKAKNSWFAKNKGKAIAGGIAAGAGLLYLNSKDNSQSPEGNPIVINPNSSELQVV